MHHFAVSKKIRQLPLTKRGIANRTALAVLAHTGTG